MSESTRVSNSTSALGPVEVRTYGLLQRYYLGRTMFYAFDPSKNLFAEVTQWANGEFTFTPPGTWESYPGLARWKDDCERYLKTVQRSDEREKLGSGMSTALDSCTTELLEKMKTNRLKVNVKVTKSDTTTFDDDDRTPTKESFNWEAVNWRS